MTSAMAYEIAQLFGAESRALAYAWSPADADQHEEAVRLHDVSCEWWAIGDDLAALEAA